MMTTSAVIHQTLDGIDVKQVLQFNEEIDYVLNFFNVYQELLVLYDCTCAQLQI